MNLKAILISCFIFLFHDIVLAQNDTKAFESDTNIVYKLSNTATVTTIDSGSFVELLNESPNAIIQFWQPWCKGTKYFLNKLELMNSYCKKNQLKFILISDSKLMQHYFSSSTKSVGLIEYYFKKNKFEANTYIVQPNRELLYYKEILANLLIEQKFDLDNFCFMIKENRIIYQENSAYFYKHILKDFTTN